MPLPIPLEILLAATLETALNQLLALDEQSARRRQPLHGKVLQLELRELKPLWLVFSPSRVDLLRTAARSPAGTADGVVVTRPRSQVLAAAAPGAVIVEIQDGAQQVVQAIGQFANQLKS